MSRLENLIRNWGCSCGNEVDKDELIFILLELVERVEQLEDAIAKATGETK